MVPPSPTSSTSTRRYSVEEDATLKDVDRLLAGDEETQGPRLPTNRSLAAGAPPAALLSLLALYLSSTVSAYAAPLVAIQPRLYVLSLPLAHFALLVLLAYAHAAIRPRSIFGSVAARFLLGRGGGTEERWARKLGLLTGGVSALSMLLGLWEAKWLDGKLGQAIEVLLLPTLLLLAPFFNSFVSSSARSPPPPPTTFSLACLTSAFFVALALFGVPARHAGLAAAALKLPLVAIKMLLLKEGMGEVHMGQYLMSSATNGALVSFIALIFGILRRPDDTMNEMLRHEYHALALYTIATLASQLSLLFALYNLASPLYAAITLLPRNLTLILLATLGRGGLVLRNNWLQMVVILAGGSYATVATDDDLSASIRDMVRRRRQGQMGWESEQHPLSRDSTPKHLPRKVVLLPFLPVLVYLLQSPSATASLVSACSYLPVNVRGTLCHTTTSPVSRTIDLVISYHNENLTLPREHIQALKMRPFIRERETRVIVYNKGPKTESEIREGMDLRRSDDVVNLPNYGREGATYLRHILLHYNASINALASAIDPYSSYSATLDASSPLGARSSRPLADHTYFLQHHLAWDWIANPRIDLVADDTGFATFGPMMLNKCGYDTRTKSDFSYVPNLYNIFRGEFCPPEGILSAWSAQFVLSKRRILANAYHRYEALDEMMEAPNDSWIHELHGAQDSGGRDNPALGHHLERSWPAIFACTDLSLVDSCPDDGPKDGSPLTKEKCQCLDV